MIGIFTVREKRCRLGVPNLQSGKKVGFQAYLSDDNPEECKNRADADPLHSSELMVKKMSFLLHRGLC